MVFISKGKYVIPVKKDTVALIVPIAIIIILGLVIVNIDKIFPTPSASDKIGEIGESVNFTASETGTSPNASVTLVEFSDFLCPACAMGAPEVKKVMDYYGDRVNVVFKHYPAHDGADILAQASECARDQEKFWEYHDLLFENPLPNVGYLESVAESLGLDMDEFGLCLSSGEKDAKVRQDFMEGLSSNIRGTPTFFVNDIQMVGAQSFEEFKQVIDKELKK